MKINRLLNLEIRDMEKGPAEGAIWLTPSTSSGTRLLSSNVFLRFSDGYKEAVCIESNRDITENLTLKPDAISGCLDGII